MALVELIGGAALGAVFGELVSEVLRVKDNAVMFRSKLEELEETLQILAPVIHDIEELNKRLNGPDYLRETIVLKKLMEEGKKLVHECSQIRRVNFLKRSRYQQRLVELDNKILRFHNLYLQAHMARDQKQTLLAVNKIVMSLNLVPDYHSGYSNLSVALATSTTGPSNQPQITKVVLKLYFHCEICAKTIKRRILRMEGVESMELDFNKSQLGVKGVFDPTRLLEYVYKRTGRTAIIVKQQPEKIEEIEEAKEAQEKEKKAEEGGEKERKEDDERKEAEGEI